MSTLPPALPPSDPTLISGYSTLLETTRDPWPIAASLIGVANLVLLAVLFLR